jgi:hypothetical protein
VLSPADGDIAVASLEAGPVVLARPRSKAVALGFHPGRGELRFDLTTPLLVANILRWLEPGVLRVTELHAGSVGAVVASIGRGVDPETIRVLADSRDLPFTVQDDAVRFFAGSPGIVRVLAGGREQVYSLALPEVADKAWNPPAQVRRGVPGFAERAVSRDLWQILATLGTFGLVAEWLIFARRRVAPLNASPGGATAAAAAVSRFWRKAS